MDKLYVLTEEINDYNQHGEYFLGVFKDIPTFKEVNDCDAYFGKLTRNNINHLLKMVVYKINLIMSFYI